jgi:hypothetical protein
MRYKTASVFRNLSFRRGLMLILIPLLFLLAAAGFELKEALWKITTEKIR